MVLTRDYTSCHGARSILESTLVMTIAINLEKCRWPAKGLDLNPIDHLMDLLKRLIRAQPLQLNLRELTRIIHQLCASIPQQYIHRHILSMSTRYLSVNATPVGCTETKLNTK